MESLRVPNTRVSLYWQMFENTFLLPRCQMLKTWKWQTAKKSLSSMIVFKMCWHLHKCDFHVLPEVVYLLCWSAVFRLRWCLLLSSTEERIPLKETKDILINQINWPNDYELWMFFEFWKQSSKLIFYEMKCVKVDGNPCF